MQYRIELGGPRDCDLVENPHDFVNTKWFAIVSYFLGEVAAQHIPSAIPQALPSGVE